MNRTPQHVYASNLLREQRFGYPLRNPRPKDKFDEEGFQIGDVGYIDKNGKFNWVLHISSPPQELQDRIQGFHVLQPVYEPAFGAKKVFTAGVQRDPVAGKSRYFHIPVDISYKSYMASQGLIMNLL